ncbi:MAG: tRNA (adenine(22)-N(1))-methyltransferase [Lachnospiraceae bacterium]
MSFSNRMKMVASFVPEGSRIADIGTDHAFVPIELVRSGKIPSAIAMDINPGPLDKAICNIKEFGLSHQIQCRLSDGLENLKDEEADVIIMAGMGGDLMIQILEKGSHALITPKGLVLQPQSEWGRVRHYLHDHGFRIDREEMIVEDGKYYVAMYVFRGLESYQEEYQYEFGKLLIDNRNQDLYRYLKKEETTYSHIFRELKERNTEAIVQRRHFIESYLSCIKGALREYESE